MKKTFCDICGKQTEDTISAGKSIRFITSGGINMTVMMFRNEDVPDADVCFPCVLEEVAKEMHLLHHLNPSILE